MLEIDHIHMIVSKHKLLAMKVPLHVVQARRTRLAELVGREGYLPVAVVCERFGISEATARRDLAALAKANAITRTRGGALVEYNQRFPSFRERQDIGDAGKRRIARAARRLIKPGMTIWLDSGTTIFRLAECLIDQPAKDLVVVTNSLPVAETLADRLDMAVHLLGGQYFRRSSLLLGGRSLANLAEWRFDVAILGAEGMSREGLWNSHDDIVALQRAAIARTRSAVVVADATKVGHSAATFLGDWRLVTHLITDAAPRTLAECGITLASGQLIEA